MQEKLIVIKNNRTIQGFKHFVNELAAAVKDGWYPLPPDKMGLYDTPNFLNSFAVKVYKEDEPYKILDDKTLKKDELESLAKKYEIELPEGMNAPAAIRKYMKEVLLSRLEIETE